MKTKNKRRLFNWRSTPKGKAQRGKVFINWVKLQRRCTMDIKDFAAELPVKTGSLGVHFFKDNDAKVLAVAHLDTVQQSKTFKKGKTKDGRLAFTSPRFDNRLGAYIILDLLPELGVKTDILLTDGEESGRSTATDFTAPNGKDYNFVFAFDREGMDVVMYQYQNDESTEELKKHGLSVSYGTFSDIGRLGHLGAVCFNFGNGHYNSHFPTTFLVVEETIKQVKRFMSFWNQNKDKVMPYDEADDKFGDAWGSYYDDYYSTGAWWSQAYGHDGGKSFGKKRGRTRIKKHVDKWRECRGCGENCIFKKRDFRYDTDEDTKSLYLCENCGLIHWADWTGGIGTTTLVTDWNYVDLHTGKVEEGSPSSSSAAAPVGEYHFTVRCDSCYQWITNDTVTDIQGYRFCDFCVGQLDAEEREVLVPSKQKSLWTPDTDSLFGLDASQLDAGPDVECDTCEVAHSSRDLYFYDGLLVCWDCEKSLRNFKLATDDGSKGGT